MQTPLEIEFHNVDRSPAVEAEIRRRVEKLDRIADGIVACRAVVDLPHRRRSTGDIYHVLLTIEVPGSEIVVSRDPGPLEQHTDPFLAVRHAFDAAERQLRGYRSMRRREIKRHDEPLRGRVVEVNAGDGFGRIESALDGREIYFHRNSVSGAAFEELEVGVEVFFDEEAGDKGPQATYVKVLGPGHVAG